MQSVIQLTVRPSSARMGRGGRERGKRIQRMLVSGESTVLGSFRKAIGQNNEVRCKVR